MSHAATILGVRVVSAGSGGAQAVDVALDENGVIQDIRPARTDSGRYLVPPLVDLHLDVLSERRRPRATVELGIPEMLLDLDAECAGAGIGTVCVGARFEDEPGRGIRLEDAIAVCRAVESLADYLLADWRIHARVEVTDEGVVEALTQALRYTNRISLISAMEHSFEKSRFASAADHRKFYAEDWGVAEDEVEAMMARKHQAGTSKDRRREQVAEVARSNGIALASHDDASIDEVDRARSLGATVCEFPLTVQAALHARKAGMVTVLGAPNALRGRSTSPGNLLVSDAIGAGACSALCSDYLPHSMLGAVFALERNGVAPLPAIIDMVSTAPAAAIGVSRPQIRLGAPLNGVLVEQVGHLPIVTRMWRDGRLQVSRGLAGSQPSPRRLVPAATDL
jgi:alpha-D-ribose 1-methylphosphonate 5-triphosphate diphosphatase